MEVVTRRRAEESANWLVRESERVGGGGLWIFRRFTRRRFRCGAEAETAEVTQQGLIFGRKPFHEFRVVEPLFARRFGEVAQGAQPSLDGLPAVLRHLPPSRQNFIANVILLLRRHLPPDVFPVADFLALLRRQPVPLVEPAANLFLPLGGKIAETRIVVQEAPLLLRAHLAEPLHPRGRNAPARPRAAVPGKNPLRIAPVSGRRIGIGIVGLRGAVLLVALTLLRPCGPVFLALLAAAPALCRRGQNQTRSRQQGQRPANELEPEESHYMFWRSATGVSWPRSDSGSKFESTS